MQFSVRHRSKGFALLITVTLLAFLVLLLVSLASLTRVETQVAGNSQQFAQARQNALMALNIALGELQKSVGPDQRITARSDMNSALGNTSTQSGRWLGAYGRATLTADTTARNLYKDIPSTISNNIVANSDANGNQAVLLNWLVSGNEGTGFDPSTAVDVNGQIVRSKAPTSFAFTPAGAVNLTGTPTALSTDITITGAAGAKPACLLVGGNSVTALSDYVAAPLKDITVVPGIVPGAGGTSNVAIGRYAWWVGDEGAKARINLPLTATAAAAKANAFVSSQRAAIELVDGKNAVGSTAAFATTDLMGNNSAYNPTQANLASVMNNAQLPLLSPANSTALATAAKYRFHDLTGYSTSVLSDTYAGGLKKDLSALLAAGAASPLDTDHIFQPETNTATDKNNEFGLPTWGQLRSFVQTRAPAGSLASSPPAGLKPRVPSFTLSAKPVATNVGISPVMTYFALGFRYLAPDGDVEGGRVRLGLYPLVVLWNPYTTDMLPADYEVGILRTAGAYLELQGREGSVPPDTAWTSSTKIEFKNLSYPNAAVWTDPYFRFVIHNDKGIPAGQSLVFTLASSHGDYSPANNILTNEYNPTNCVLLASASDLRIGTAPVPGAGGIYRVGSNGDSTKTFAGNPARQAMLTIFTAEAGDPYNTNPYYFWAGNGNQQAYLGSTVHSSAKPYGDPPLPHFAFSSGNYKSREWYQIISSYINQTNNAHSPYGPTPSYPTDPSAGTLNSEGKWPALLQSTGVLKVAANPAWRMHIKAKFKNSEGRWIAQNNPRALMSTNSRTMSSVPNFTGSDYNVASWPSISIDYNDDNQAVTSAGDSLESTTIVTTSLFEFLPASMPFLSLGQLQHANLSWFSAVPSYAIGNSIGAVPFAGFPEKVVRLESSVITPGKVSDPTFTAFYDHAWLLNHTLWDQYFVSTVPNKGTGTEADATVLPETTVPDPLPNPRHLRYNIDPAPSAAAAAAGLLRNADTAAAHLTLSGGFNINSTSEQAWRAILAGSNGLSYDPTGTAVGGPAYAKTVFSRFAKPTTNNTASIWQGYRQLTDEQIAQFAKNIVAEIRRRGPFVSLGDFINRRLHSTQTFPQANDARLKGTLQAALDATTTGTSAINNAGPTPPPNPPKTDPATFSWPLVNWDFPNAFQSGSGSAGVPAQTAPYSTTSAFAPQFLTQADVLASIGSGLTARSDTFVIRTYGDVLNPASSTSSSPIVTARAWCEAVVQRVPDYVKPGTTSTAAGDPATTATATLQNAENLKFGRKFKIISFRWLSPNDI